MLEIYQQLELHPNLILQRYVEVVYKLFYMLHPFPTCGPKDIVAPASCLKSTELDDSENNHRFIQGNECLITCAIF